MSECIENCSNNLKRMKKYSAKLFKVNNVNVQSTSKRGGVLQLNTLEIEKL